MQHWGPNKPLPLAKVIPLRFWNGKARIAAEETKPQAKGNLNSFALLDEGFGAGREVQDLSSRVVLIFS